MVTYHLSPSNMAPLQLTFSDFCDWKQHIRYVNIHSVQKRLHTEGDDLGFLCKSDDRGFLLGRQGWGQKTGGTFQSDQGGLIHLQRAKVWGMWGKKAGMRKTGRALRRLALQAMVRTWPLIWAVELAVSREMMWSCLWLRRTSLLRMRIWDEKTHWVIELWLSMLSRLVFCFLITFWPAQFLFFIYVAYLS